MNNTHWMVRLVKYISVLFVLFGCFLVFLYSPFYSQLVAKGLNTFVSFEVNEIAAQSQKQAALSENENLEPGSDLWIARQAYLKVMEQDISEHGSENITLIQARYKILQEQLLNLQREEQEEKAQAQKENIQVPLLVKNSQQAPIDPSQNVVELLNWNSSENKEQIDQYTEFLTTHDLSEYEAAISNAASDIDAASEIYANKTAQTQDQTVSQPYAIVVLGGGLTLHDNGEDIIVNDYTRLRLETTLKVEKQYRLPIVLSGVEAPYMQRWLKNYDVDAKLLEDRSMNTCENTRFSSLLLQKKGGAPTVILITDRYHMPRTRRLFALNGIQTIPVEAPMPSALTAWRPSVHNYDHSRRANYEMLATIRDMWFGSTDCREVP
ncbi:YdcF family protein [Acinetobacter wanghuae]|uniref:YdcF family protein n=1 Tax=Acinetobacter wanghuae TaxID=2662362 RepID=UPI003AF9085B